MTPARANPEKGKARNARYDLSEKGIARRLRYAASPKGLARYIRYGHSAKGRARNKLYESTSARKLMQAMNSARPHEKLRRRIDRKRWPQRRADAAQPDSRNDNKRLAGNVL